MAGQDVCHEKQHEGATAPSSCSVAFRHNMLIFSVTDDGSSFDGISSSTSSSTIPNSRKLLRTKAYANSLTVSSIKNIHSNIQHPLSNIHIFCGSFTIFPEIKGLEPVFNKVNNRLPAPFPLCVVAPQLNAAAFAIVAPSLEKKPLANESSPLLNTGS